MVDIVEVPTRRSPSYRARRSWWLRLRHDGKAALGQLPLLGSTVLRVWRVAKYLYLRIRWRVQGFVGTLTGTYASGLDVHRITWVSPGAIQYCSLQAFNLVSMRGRVVGGDWDCLEKRFEDLDIYIALRQVCIEGKSWEETAYYQWVLERLSAGQTIWGCRTQSEFDQRCKERERLFHAIRSEGYQSQRERARAQTGFHPLLKSETEVAVSIGRFGDLMFSDGAHRLAIAKLLGVAKIPVEIAVRHPGWLERRGELLQFAEGPEGGIYHGVTHPDLSETSAPPGNKDRFSRIRRAMAAPSGTLLDLGGDLGYSCPRFEEAGFNCIAVGVPRAQLRYLRELARVENRGFAIVAESALDWQGIRETDFDVVLALRTFHQYLRDRLTYHRFITFLENLRTKELFFEPSSELQVANKYASFDPEDFVEFLLANSRLEMAESIGVSNEGSPLFRLYREGSE